jgi:hypothetical protein
MHQIIKKSCRYSGIAKEIDTRFLNDIANIFVDLKRISKDQSYSTVILLNRGVEGLRLGRSGNLNSRKQKTPGFASGGNHNHISLVRNLEFS